LFSITEQALPRYSLFYVRLEGSSLLGAFVTNGSVVSHVKCGLRPEITGKWEIHHKKTKINNNS